MKKKLTITVCDVCEDEGRVTEEYRAALPEGRLKRFDLCDEHALPLRRLFDPKVKPVPAKKIRQRPPTRVVNLDETA